MAGGILYYLLENRSAYERFIVNIERLANPLAERHLDPFAQFSPLRYRSVTLNR